jgi:hypothetical protein
MKSYCLLGLIVAMAGTLGMWGQTVSLKDGVIVKIVHAEDCATMVSFRGQLKAIKDIFPSECKLDAEATAFDKWTGTPIAGQLRHGSKGQIQIWDGKAWIDVPMGGGDPIWEAEQEFAKRCHIERMNIENNFPQPPEWGKWEPAPDLRIVCEPSPSPK